MMFELVYEEEQTLIVEPFSHRLCVDFFLHGSCSLVSTANCESRSKTYQAARVWHFPTTSAARPMMLEIPLVREGFVMVRLCEMVRFLCLL